MFQTDWEIPLANFQATQNLGKQLAQLLPPNSVILLEGELGAGKTTLVQGLGAGLGINTPIVSPTFTLINEYLEGQQPLYHFDLYRLDTGKSIEQLFPELYWEGKEVTPGITAIEWSQKLPYFPENYLKIELLKTETARLAKITVTSSLLAEIVQKLDRVTE